MVWIKNKVGKKIVQLINSIQGGMRKAVKPESELSLANEFSPYKARLPSK
jgi:hypothetical protein